MGGTPGGQFYFRRRYFGKEVDSSGAVNPPVASSQSAIRVAFCSNVLSLTSTTNFDSNDRSISSWSTSFSRKNNPRSSYCEGLLEIFIRRFRAPPNESGCPRPQLRRNPSFTNRASN